MSFRSDFNVAGNKYDIVQCHFYLKQKYSHNGKPASGVHAGNITVILEGTEDSTLGSWIADPTKKQDGKIVFYRVDQQDTTFKEVTFEGAYLLTLMESFITETQTSEALLLESESIVTDIGPEDNGDTTIIKFATSDLFSCQRLTGRSYCVLLRISAEKITIDGVEHQN